MTRSALLLAACAAGLAAGPAAAQSDAFPVQFIPSDNGSEGCYAQWATRSAVRAHTAPTAQSRHVRTVDAERRIDANDYSETLAASLRPGLARATRAASFEVRATGEAVSRSVPVAAGAEVAVLGFGPEGSVFVEHGGAVYGTFLDGFYGEGGPFERVREPIVETWVRLVAHGPDRPEAWVNTDQAGVVPREPFCY